MSKNLDVFTVRIKQKNYDELKRISNITGYSIQNLANNFLERVISERKDKIQEWTLLSKSAYKRMEINEG